MNRITDSNADAIYKRVAQFNNTGRSDLAFTLDIINILDELPEEMVFDVTVLLNQFKAKEVPDGYKLKHPLLFDLSSYTEWDWIEKRNTARGMWISYAVEGDFYNTIKTQIGEDLSGYYAEFIHHENIHKVDDDGVHFYIILGLSKEITRDKPEDDSTRTDVPKSEAELIFGF